VTSSSSGGTTVGSSGSSTSTSTSSSGFAPTYGLCETCNNSFPAPIECQNPQHACANQPGSSYYDPGICAPNCAEDGGCPSGLTCVQTTVSSEGDTGQWSSGYTQICIPDAGCGCISVQGGCSADEDCCEGLVCSSGICLVPFGGQCQASDPGEAFPNPCLDGGTCVGGMCDGCILDGGACPSGSGCCNGLQCSLDYVCAAPSCLLYGQPCLSSNLPCCGDGYLVCDTEQAECVIGAENSCDPGQSCVTGEFCSNGFCTP
jgi:hypothetical protein